MKKSSKTPSGIDRATFCLVAHCLYQQRHRVLPCYIRTRLCSVFHVHLVASTVDLRNCATLAQLRTSRCLRGSRTAHMFTRPLLQPPSQRSQPTCCNCTNRKWKGPEAASLTRELHMQLLNSNHELTNNYYRAHLLSASSPVSPLLWPITTAASLKIKTYAATKHVCWGGENYEPSVIRFDISLYMDWHTTARGR